MGVWGKRMRRLRGVVDDRRYVGMECEEGMDGNKAVWEGELRIIVLWRGARPR